MNRSSAPHTLLAHDMGAVLAPIPEDVSVLVSPTVARTATVLNNPPRFIRVAEDALYIGYAAEPGSTAPPTQLYLVRVVTRTSRPDLVVVITDVDMWITYAHDIPDGILAEAATSLGT